MRDALMNSIDREASVSRTIRGANAASRFSKRITPIFKCTLMVAAITLLVVLSKSSWGAHESQERPNIVFCFADDWGRYASAYRQGANDRTPNAVVNTPNFDRVASEGVLFNNAFVNAP